MKRFRVLTSCVIATVVLAGMMVPAGARSGLSADTDPSMTGEWLAPFSEAGLFDEQPPMTPEEAKKLPTAVSIAVAPDGTILYWNGTENYEDTEISFGMEKPQQGTLTRVLDVRAYRRGEADRPTWSVPSQERGIGGDLFCSDLRNLADGRLLVVGGTRYVNHEESLGLPGGYGRTDAQGLKDVRVYDTKTQTWTMVEPMNHARWYPSLLTLPGNKMFVAGGIEQVAWNDKMTFVNQTETFDLATGGWTDNGPTAETPLPFYARLHLLPNGKVFYGATGQMWGPGPLTPTPDSVEWNVQKTYDPKTNSWSDVGLAPLGARDGAFSAMLPLKAPYDKARIVIGGGTSGVTTPGAWVANDSTEIVDVDGDDITRSNGPRLNNRRWFSSPVVLPSGELIALGGGDKDDNVFPGITSAVRQAEMFDGHKWVPLAAGKRDRLYHSTAILLGDGSILMGGHAPPYFTPFGLKPGNHTQGAFSSNLRDPSFEIYEPPYLFRGQRPRLVQVQAGIGLGETFTITTPDASKVTSVVVSRLPAVTHLADADQRTVELGFEKSSSGTIEASTPDDPAVVLPGYYYLFIMSDNGAGPTPSRAAIVQVGETDISHAPLPFGT